MVRVVKGYKEETKKTEEDRRLFGVPETWEEAYWFMCISGECPTESWRIKPLDDSPINVVTVYRFLTRNDDRDITNEEIKRYLGRKLEKVVLEVAWHDFGIDKNARIEYLYPHDKDAW